MELAAIASAAVPGLAPTGVAGAPDDAADFDSALLVDDAGKQWRVRSPRHAEASMRLETELQALRAFTHAVKAELPFLVPHMAGSVRQGELSTFVYSHLAGSTRPLEGLAAGGRAMAQELGRAIAAIHELPKEMVQRADLPSYEAEEYRQRKLNELDQAATTGKIPAILLRRWEHALEDVSLWRFGPTVMHGDLHEDHLLISAGRVSAVTGWTDLSVGDPAEDFAWLAAAEDTAFVEAVYAAYTGARTAAVDPHLARRAALAAEFALAQWLVRGVSLGDAAMVLEAEDMLGTLSADVESIEREQLEAAERERRAEEERIEWGDDNGEDDVDLDLDLDLDDRYTVVGHIDSAENSADSTDGTDGTVHSTTAPAPAPAPAPNAASGSGSSAVDGSGSESDGAEQTPGQGEDTSSVSSGTRESHSSPHARGLREGRDTPSGSSLAHARLVAARQPRPTNAGTGSSSVAPATDEATTDAEGTGRPASSPDDVQTTALPIISSRR
ncbi:Phosphotransferase enzyme family [Arthrobacter agilis]|uniref:macrolide 2'-phosphotransferase n=1 Tax=Arthrobacter agilis TaxID=37921 RepID=UPI000F6FEB6F|nr:macrolide 2'-phosphotransferase [Arthrobacter agilis]VDR32774.1 Phosphotransferase enzyme family [Arthrobacter agilis]